MNSTQLLKNIADSLRKQAAHIQDLNHFSTTEDQTRAACYAGIANTIEVELVKAEKENG